MKGRKVHVFVQNGGREMRGTPLTGMQNWPEKDNPEVNVHSQRRSEKKMDDQIISA